jgi:hypothetical protein
MQIVQRDSVRAVLLLSALAFIHGCGGGGGGGASTANSNEPGSPAVPTPAPGAGPAPSPTPAGNSAPTITNAANATARVGSAYSFQPAASDADGDSLTFSAENLPPWASIDAKTGQITGTPAAGDVGEYESISIAVADAAHKAATEPFTITVTNDAAVAGSGVASLQWGQPVSKVDGSVLDDLAGYRIAYGRSADDLDHSIFINDPTQTSYDFATLASGTWYFAVMAVNANGLEGPPTPTAEKSI